MIFENVNFDEFDNLYTESELGNETNECSYLFCHGNSSSEEILSVICLWVE